MPIQTESYSIHVKSKMSDVEKKARVDSGKSSISCYEEDMDMSPEESGDCFWNFCFLNVDPKFSVRT